MSETRLLSCHTCGAEVSTVRSVLLQHLPDHRIVRVVYAPGCIGDEVLDLADRKWTGPNDPAYLQFRKDIATRRAFICEACYRALDTLDGLSEFKRDGRTNAWSMSVSSRGGKAAIYDKRKWLGYQKRLANKLGIDLSR